MNNALLFSKAIFICFIFSNFAWERGYADSSCDCIDVATYQAPNNQTRYTISCYLGGEKKDILEEGQLPDSKLIAVRAGLFKEIYKAPNCLWFPGGKRIAPKNK